MNMSLKERMTNLRSQYEVVLPSEKYIMCMIDGKNFSRLIKNFFKKPFDEDFINMMNEVAKFVCQQIQYSYFAYVQSDEITFCFYNDKDENSQAFFGNRMSKLGSIIPSTATAKFNQLMIQYEFEKLTKYNNEFHIEEIKSIISNSKLGMFDCKIWTCDNYNDVFAYYLWRQIDCIRNSKQQAAQTYISHKELVGKDTDEQIKLLQEKEGINWHTDFNDGMKYGRFIYKEKEHFVSEKYGEYDRSVWKSHYAFPLMEEGGKDRFKALSVIPVKYDF